MENETRNWFLHRAANSVGFLLDQFDPPSGRFHPERWDERYNNVIYPLAYLYRTPDPHNPHTGAEHLVQAALAGGDVYVKTQNEFGEWPHAPSGGYCLAEWPAYYLTETFALLRDGMAAAQRTRWEKTLERYATHACRRPFSLTSPSNEAWKCLVLFRLGQLLDREEWCKTARFQREQLARTQRPEGYWDEPVLGHGASPTYHHLHLGALGLFTCYSGEAEGPDLRRAWEFAVTASYPDGTPLDCLDGRSAFAPEAVLSSAPVLARHPAGRRLLQSVQRTLDELRGSDPRRQFASTWSAFIEPCFLVDAHRHFPAEQVPVPESAPLGEGTVRLGQGFTVRRAPWFAAAVDGVSDTALVSADHSAFERQSRFSLWHDRWGVILGGGSQARTSYLSPVNVMLATGCREVTCSFGEVRSLTRKELEDPTIIASAYHQPRAATSGPTPEGMDLRLDYGHGTVVIHLRILSPEACELDFVTTLRGVQTACCQLPVLVTYHTRLAVDGNVPQPVDLARAEWLTRTLDRSLTMQRPDRDAQVVIRCPQDTKLKFHFPLHPGFGWQQDAHFDPAFAVG